MLLFSSPLSLMTTKHQQLGVEATIPASTAGFNSCEEKEENVNRVKSSMDLNIVVESEKKRDPANLIVKKLQSAERLGYKVVALSVIISRTDAGKYLPDPPLIQVPDSCRMKVLTRVTVCLEDQNIIYKILQNASFKQYDLFAVHPLNDKILNQVCGGSLECDIVTFDFSERLPVDLKRANLTLPRQRGICFEINYTQMFTSQSGRANSISSAQLLVEKTKGKNVIASSSAKTAMSLRSPHDVANMSLLFAMSVNQGKSSVFTNGDLCLKHSDARRNSNSIAVTVSSEKDTKDQILKKKLLQAMEEPMTKKAKIN